MTTFLDRLRARQLTPAAREAARRAARGAFLWSVLLAVVVLAHRHQDAIPVRDDLLSGVFALLLLITGWNAVRLWTQATHPAFAARMDPAAAGTTEFALRLVGFFATVGMSLTVAGIKPQTLLLGGAVTALVVGLAAQQVLGNLFAGLILFTARTYRLGDRIALQAGALAGTLEGEVVGLGLMYTTFRDEQGNDRLVPNSVLLASVVTPLRRPDAVDVQVKLRPGVLITQVQHLLDVKVTTPLQEQVQIELVQIESHIVVRIYAVPVEPTDGAKLADEVLRALRGVASGDGEIDTEEFQAIVEADGHGATGRALDPSAVLMDTITNDHHR